MGRSILLLALVSCFALSASGQSAPAPGRVPTVTRQVKLFSELEARISAEADAGNTSALERLVDPSFEMRVGAHPGAPVPRDAWIREARGVSGGRITQMAVHDFGTLAVVSFRETPASGGHDRFIVDCWKRAGDDWLLAVRYLSDASSDVGLPESARTLDKRY